MLRIGEYSTDGRRRVVPPQIISSETTLAVLAVWLSQDEEVEWHWNDNVVIGYTIYKKSCRQEFVRCSN